jgi:hypothetical protein
MSVDADAGHSIVAECQDAAAWNEGIQKAGHHVFTSGLQSPRTARTLRKRNGELSITDGPFTETKECLGGFTIIEARDMHEAIGLVSMAGNCWRNLCFVRSS